MESPEPPIVAEETALLRTVATALNASPPETAVNPSEAKILEDLDRLREALREGEKTEDDGKADHNEGTGSH